MAADPPDTIYLDEDDEWSCVHDPASSGADGEEFDVCCEDDGLRPPTASESTGVKLPTVRSLDNLSGHFQGGVGLGDVGTTRTLRRSASMLSGEAAHGTLTMIFPPRGLAP